MARRKALLICPGRGSYTRTELGYLARWRQAQQRLIDMADAIRRDLGQPTIRELDGAESYSPALHSRGDNASPLIFACSYTDFEAISPTAVDIVAIVGNSMGWYTALACGDALTPQNALRVVNTMGRITHEGLVGGQLIHTTVGEDWRPIPGRREALVGAMEAARAEAGTMSISIELGGMIVFAGETAALDAFVKRAPPGPGNFPFRLASHGAFHTPLMAAAAGAAREALPADWFSAPRIPLIDGRGHVWRPYATDPGELWDYTFGAQVLDTYDFTASVRVGMREFAPDCVILLGPGETLGGAIAQVLIGCNCDGLQSKRAFQERQERAPLLISMARPEQRAAVEYQGLPASTPA